MTRRNHNTDEVTEQTAEELQNEAAETVAEAGIQQASQISSTGATLESIEQDLEQIKSVLVRILGYIQTQEDLKEAGGDITERVRNIEDALRANGFRNHI